MIRTFYSTLALASFLAAFFLPFNACAAEIASWNADAISKEATSGLRVLDGADGTIAYDTRGDARCVTNKPMATPTSAYLYFDVTADVKGVPVYVSIEYFDGAPGGRITLNYDSATGDTIDAKFQGCEQQWGGQLTERNTWRTTVFLLKKPMFANRQNLGADFRLTGATMFIRSVRISTEEPKDLEALNAISPEDMKARVKIGPNKQLIIGGFDPVDDASGKSMCKQLEGAMIGLKSIGVTSHESYVRWNLCEPEEGRYDWRIYDSFVELYKKYNIKWVPFLIVGSPYSLPDWYYKKPGSQGYVCLEHGEESDVQSLWNPVLRKHVARFIQAFCEHYRDSGVIESILLGITGNYGEAIYPVTGNDWTADVHGKYHTHPGFWAGDPFAIANLQQGLSHKYGEIAKLNKAWGTSYKQFEEVKPFLREKAPNDRAWLDFCDWYIGSMTDWSKFWLRTTRDHFSKGDIYLCTGGHAPAEHGADFGEQCKMAAEIGGGVRITNEGSNYAANFSLTRWVASASRQYGAYYSFEPAGEVNTNGVVARIYNATASGARGLHYYYPNLFGFDASCKNFIAWGGLFQDHTPSSEIAVYYPETFVKLNNNSQEFLGMLQPLRDRFDFEYRSDNQVRDGGLKNVKALILLWGNVVEADVWKNIAQWVQDGGLLLYADGIGRLRTVEGDESIHEQLLGAKPTLGKGRVLSFNGVGKSPEYRDFLSTELAKAKELSETVRTLVTLDGKEDKVYGSVCDDTQIFWMNYTDKECQKGETMLPPYSIIMWSPSK